MSVARCRYCGEEVTSRQRRCPGCGRAPIADFVSWIFAGGTCAFFGVVAYDQPVVGWAGVPLIALGLVMAIGATVGVICEARLGITSQHQKGAGRSAVAATAVALLTLAVAVLYLWYRFAPDSPLYMR